MNTERKIHPDEGYELIDRSPAMPPEADFCLRLGDDSMSPYLSAGETVFVKARAELEEFDAGIFLYEGAVLCRQWCEDYGGTVHLLCANPACRDKNISIPRTQRQKLRCLGKVLLSEKLPAPVYA